MTGTVTVRRADPAHERTRRFTVEFSRLPGRSYGPYDFAETVRELYISALLTRRAARDLVVSAAVTGSATTETRTEP